jgi:hypothetical protein
MQTSAESKNLETSLADAVASPRLGDLLIDIADVGIDKAISSGLLDAIPVFGVLSGAWKAKRDIQKELFVRKILRFLSALNTTDHADRAKFSENLRREGKSAQFGEAILLILDRIDDTEKPSIIGRILAAHVRGEYDYATAMRLAAIVNRCYIQDLQLMKSFKPGLQRELTPIAESLFAAGLLSSGGIDGGSVGDPLSGGTIYKLNEYGALLVKFGLA